MWLKHLEQLTKDPVYGWIKVETNVVDVDIEDEFSW
jgi:hypothetical protein